MADDKEAQKAQRVYGHDLGQGRGERRRNRHRRGKERKSGRDHFDERIARANRRHDRQRQDNGICRPEHRNPWKK